MASKKTHGKKGFSLLELVVVVVIIGIIAAVAIPRMSRGSAGAAEAALSGNLAVLRNALDMYSAEHTGAFPKVDVASDALTKYTDSAGGTSDARDATHLYGPYLRKVPPLPVGAAKGNTALAVKTGVGVGWIYDDTNGDIAPNTTATEKDATGKLYTDY